MCEFKFSSSFKLKIDEGMIGVPYFVETICKDEVITDYVSSFRTSSPTVSLTPK